MRWILPAFLLHLLRHLPLASHIDFDNFFGLLLSIDTVSFFEFVKVLLPIKALSILIHTPFKHLAELSLSAFDSIQIKEG